VKFIGSQVEWASRVWVSASRRNRIFLPRYVEQYLDLFATFGELRFVVRVRD